MVPETSLLVLLVPRADRLPLPLPQPRRGRPPISPERLASKALVRMVLRRLPKVHRLLPALAESKPEMRRRHTLLTENGR